VAVDLETGIRNTPLPEQLRQFTPKVRRHVPRTQRRWLRCFVEDGYVIYHFDFTRVYAVLVHAFSELLPFVIYYDPERHNMVVATAAVVAQEGLREMEGWLTVYEWDGQDVPDFSELKCR
jgi:hypothetical protein